jgi:hypothetical protein
VSKGVSTKFVEEMMKNIVNKNALEDQYYNIATRRQRR